jgi:hypothetical protein
MCTCLCVALLRYLRTIAFTHCRCVGLDFTNSPKNQISFAKLFQRCNNLLLRKTPAKVFEPRRSSTLFTFSDTFIYVWVVQYKNKYEKPQVMLQPVNPCSEYEAKNVTEGRGKYGSAVSKGIVCLAKNLLTSKISCMAPSPTPPFPIPRPFFSPVGQCLNSFSLILFWSSFCYIEHF